MKSSNIHFIGIGGIGVSGLARYYASFGYSISGSDSTESDLIRKLQDEGFKIFIGENPDAIPSNTTRIIYSEAIITKPDLPVEEQIYNHRELKFAKENNIIHIPYPIALAEVFNAKKGIAVAGSHGKSTTASIL
ncbi:UDP-N-acetylmuramate--L-alanine ligase, partial [Candidatus Gracilibacteria bacterium]